MSYTVWFEEASKGTLKIAVREVAPGKGKVITTMVDIRGRVDVTTDNYDSYAEAKDREAELTQIALEAGWRRY
jgi:hypothetical protein